jgi:hypothetical protein
MRRGYILLFGIAVMGLNACDKDSVAIDQGEPYLNFYDATKEYRLCVQTVDNNFYYEDESRQRDTVWIKLVSVGTKPKQDCHVQLRAYHDNTASTLSDVPDAESGKHYVPFDSEEMKKLLVFHANRLLDSIPIILLRDPTLKDEGRRLTLRLENSDIAKAADQRPDSDIEHIFVTVYTEDCLSQPINWDYSFCLGSYGQVKHDFMVRHSGKRWDAAFIATLDDNMKTYYQYKFRNELAAENEERQQQGLSVLREKNGTVVSF